MMMNAPDREDEDRPGPEDPEREPENDRTKCRDCDPRHFASRNCRRHGIEVEALYIAGEKAALEKAQTDYTTTRKAYREQRNGVALQVQDLRHQIRHLVDRVRCLIQQDRVVECLDRAYETISEQLEECGSPGGCCADEDCEFDTECPDDYDELVRRITRYGAHLQRAKGCFATLVAQPQALVDGVAAAEQAVHAVAEALTKDPSTIDLKRLYADALVARRTLHHIWNGFPETKDFLDCLCRVYDCWISAVDAISSLKREQGVRDCHRDARDAHCQELITKTSDAVLMEYERICCEPPDGSSDDDSCECGHGHRHHRDHHDHEHDHGDRHGQGC
jgi:hypothetical protein